MNSKKLRHERGQALILIVFGIIGLIGATALAVDGGAAYAEKRRVQSAADTAALGGALSRIRSGSGWVQTTYGIAAENGYNNDGVNNTVAVMSPPADGPYAGNVEYIQVVISARVPTYFANVLGIQNLSVRGEAISRTKMPEVKEILDGAAVISLAPTSDCENEVGMWVGGEATLSITGSDIFVNSNNPDCALIEQGSGSIRIDDGEIRVVGGAAIQKPRLITPFPPTTGAPPISYPPPFFMPHVNCGQDAVVSADGSSMTPGDWNEEVFPPLGVTHLEGGIYCVGGDFILNGGDVLEGTGVTIVVPSGIVRWNGGAQVNLSGGANLPLAGLLLYLPPTNKKFVQLNGNAQSSIQGTILAPGAVIRIKGNNSSYGFHSQIIGYRVEADGQSNVVIKYLDEQNWDAMTMPEVQLTK